MRPLKKFEEYLDMRVVDKRSPDKNRARSLINEAENRKSFIEQVIKKIGINDDNANYFIENVYDILIELIRARLLLTGYHSSGMGAHEAEVAYMRNLGFDEKDVRFMNDLRYFRNGILYYGKRFNSEYAQKVISFLGKVYPQLNKT